MVELSDPDPRRAIERMFEALIRRTTDPRFPRMLTQVDRVGAVKRLLIAN